MIFVYASYTKMFKRMVAILSLDKLRSSHSKLSSNVPIKLVKNIQILIHSQPFPAEIKFPI